MNSHELANKLLKLPDKPVIAVKGAGDCYTYDLQVGDPWEDLTGSIRFQLSENDDVAEGTGNGS